MPVQYTYKHGQITYSFYSFVNFRPVDTKHELKKSIHTGIDILTHNGEHK